jgi:uncharacterized protein YwgA
VTDKAATEPMKPRDFVLMTIDSAGDRPEFGRTSLQKLTYFAALALGRDLGHRPHYYGPFSNTVERDTEALVFSDLVEERVQSLGFATAARWEARQYEYKISETGRERVQQLRKHHPEEASALASLIESILEHAGRLDQRILSAAAKVHFIGKREDKAVSIDDVRRAARDYGWKLSEREVEKVMELLEKVGLARRVEGR